MYFYLSQSYFFQTAETHELEWAMQQFKVKIGGEALKFPNQPVLRPFEAFKPSGRSIVMGTPTGLLSPLPI